MYVCAEVLSSLRTSVHNYQLAGRLYDKNGIRRQWWTNASIEEFIERTQCFVQQYSKYEMFGYHVSF